VFWVMGCFELLKVTLRLAKSVDLMKPKHIKGSCLKISKDSVERLVDTVFEERLRFYEKLTLQLLY
jgi:hypothetical protein